MTKADVANYLKVSVRTINRMIANRALPYFKFTGAIRFKLADVQARLNETSRVEVRHGSTQRSALKRNR